MHHPHIAVVVILLSGCTGCGASLGKLGAPCDDNGDCAPSLYCQREGVDQCAPIPGSDSGSDATTGDGGGTDSAPRFDASSSTDAVATTDASDTGAPGSDAGSDAAPGTDAGSDAGPACPSLCAAGDPSVSCYAGGPVNGSCFEYDPLTTCCALECTPCCALLVLC
jgi:hypothetical protein